MTKQAKKEKKKTPQAAKTPWKTWKVSEKSMQRRKIQDSASGKEWNTDLNLLTLTEKQPGDH